MRRLAVPIVLLALAACSDDAPAQAVADAADAATDADAAALAAEDTAPEREIPDGWDLDVPGADADADAPPDVGADATVWPADPLADQNAWGPAGRIVRMEMPSGPAEARTEGCLVYGSKVGTGLNSLLILAGGLDQFLEPNADGDVVINLYARAEGWQPGQTALELQTVDLQMLYGDPDPSEGWLVDRRSFLDGDPELGPVLSYPQSPVSDGWLSGTPGPLVIDLNVLGLGVRLELTTSRIGGRLYADGPGMALRHGVLTGYVTQEGALALIHGIQATCEAEDAPDICGGVEAFIGIGQPDEDLIELAGNFIGGYDARMVDDVPSDCDGREGNTCNAVSVCILIDIDGIEIAGVAP
jgi:hypothetical protein